MSVRGGRSLRSQIEAALSGEGDPLGDEGLGLPDGLAPHETAIRRDGAGRGAAPANRAAAAGSGAAAGGSGAAAAGSGAAATAAGTSPRARRLPDLHVLPPLLHATGSFGALWQRLGAEDEPLPVAGRHAALAAVPHGAKTFLAGAIATGGGAEAPQRLCWVARDAEIGDRVAEELQAWLGDPEAVAVLEPRTALAYERSEMVRDETAARVAALAAWRSGRARVLVASVQALLQHTLDPAEIPAQPRRLRVGTRVHQDELLRELLALGYEPVTEVAGRGEFARRGGLVDVFPSAAALPIRIELFGDEIDAMRVFDPTDQRSLRPVEEVVLLPASEFLAPRGGVAEIAARLARLPGRLSARLPERLAQDLARFEEGIQAGTGELGAHSGHVHDIAASARALETGDAAEVWAAVLCPATGLDHVPAGTLLVLDEPGDIAESADFLWRQAQERRTELVTGGDLPEHWPESYLGPRDWKTRLLKGRTLELTWESEASAPTGGGTPMGDLFGWREPALHPARTAQLAQTIA